RQSFKNIRILSEISADQLVPAMQFISASLGVECDFCHVRDAFEKDDKKPKQTARLMMQMMLVINKQDFRGERAVTCFTCHRGSIRPVSIPMLDQNAAYLSELNSPEAVQNSTTAGLPSPEDLLTRYLRSVGGEAVNRVSSRTETGTVSFTGGGPSYPIEIVYKSPQKRLTVVRMPGGESLTGFDGQKGWVKLPGAPVREMHSGDIEGARLDADLQLPLHLKTIFQNFKTVRSEQVRGRDAFLVFANNPDSPPVEFYFDK